MEEIVTILLENYNELIKDNIMNEDTVDYLRDENKKLRKYILKTKTESYNLREYPLEDVLDLKSYRCGIDNPLKLIEMGFNVDEIKNYITEAYEAYHSEEVKDGK